MKNKTARRSFGKALSARFSPVAVVLSVASLFILGAVALRLTTVETVDAQLTIQARARRAEAKRAASASRAITFAENDLSVRYADRLREASALTLSFSLYTLHERITNKRVVPNVNAVLDGMLQSQLMPPRMTVANGSGVVQSPAGLYYIRYRPSPFGVEVLAVGAKGLQSGDVFIVRVPETSPAPSDGLPQTNLAGGYATIFTAPYADVPVPAPFSSVAQFQRAGWAQQPLRSTPYTAQQVAELNQWMLQYQSSKSEGGE